MLSAMAYRDGRAHARHGARCGRQRHCASPRCREPHARTDDVLIEVRACGVCRTDLHMRDGELRGPSCRSCSDTRSSAWWRSG